MKKLVEEWGAVFVMACLITLSDAILGMAVDHWAHDVVRTECRCK